MRAEDKINYQCQWVTRTCCKVKNSLMYVTGTVALWAMRRCRENREWAAAAGSIRTRPACPATEYPCQFNADPRSASDSSNRTYLPSKGDTDDVCVTHPTGQYHNLFDCSMYLELYKHMIDKAKFTPIKYLGHIIFLSNSEDRICISKILIFFWFTLELDRMIDAGKLRSQYIILKLTQDTVVEYVKADSNNVVQAIYIPL